MSTDPFDLGAADGAEMGPPDPETTRGIARTVGSDLKEQNGSDDKDDAA